MNDITVIIPTRNRLEKLRDTLDTIPRCDWIHIKIVCDGDAETFEAIQAMRRPDIEPTYVKGHMGSVYCRNLVAPDTPDGLLYATDDVNFIDGAFEIYRDDFNAAFPDDDGVLGIKQHTNSCKTGVALIGQKFLDRYPGRCPFNPDCWHFSAHEVGWLAEKLNKFAYCEGALIFHRSPNRNKALIDQTHWDARHFKEHDMKLRDERLAAGKTWGDV